MRARVKMTPARMEKLLTGDAFARFDRIFNKIWNGLGQGGENRIFDP